ncbi:hypothetical protein BGZ72_004476 [Mortierella alpina]|nr:hypothetical protein BGZ72_004476 [Mortierella alpina]
MSRPITNPILLPEILSNIARYVPLFEPNTDNHFYAYCTYTPENLYPCILVSRLWYQCFLPHLYHYFVDSIMTQELLPRPILFKHHSHFRRAILDKVRRPLDNNGHALIDLPTNLLGLTVYSVDADPFSHLHLLRTVCSPRLRELTWYGRLSSSTLDTPWDIIGTFSALENLVLVRWDLTSEQLRTVLLGCSQTLRSLRMHTLSGYGQEVFFNHRNQPNLELVALRELHLMLDWPQSRAVVHLPRICPSLEVLTLNVDLEEFDLQVMIDHCQRHCPRLHTIQYHEGYSMRHEYGYYPDAQLYANLFKNSTRNLRSVLIPLPQGLDSPMLDALLSQAGTLEQIELRMMRGCSLDTSMLALLLEKATALKSLVLDKVNFHVKNLELLCLQPWACRDLKTVVIQGYITEPELCLVLDQLQLQLQLLSEEIDTTEKDDTTGTKDATDAFANGDRTHRMYEGDGQGWYLQEGLNEESYAEAAQDREIKEKLLKHMYSSGLHRVNRVSLNCTDFYAEEQPPLVTTDSDSDSDSERDNVEPIFSKKGQSFLILT